MSRIIRIIILAAIAVVALAATPNPTNAVNQPRAAVAFDGPFPPPCLPKPGTVCPQ